MTGNSRDSIKKRIIDLENNPLILTPTVLDLKAKAWEKKIRILSEYEPIKPCPSPEKSDYEPCKPCPSPEKIESQSSTKQPYHFKYGIIARD